jgi:hypothetical protein
MSIEQVVSTQPKVPSKKLKDAIHNVRLGFEKLQGVVIKALEIGRAEGFTDIEIGVMVKMEMLEAGYSARTVYNILPDTAKRQYKRYHHRKSEKTSHYQEPVTADEAPTGYYQGEANEYDVNAVEQYDRLYLIKVVKYLHQELWNDTVKWDKKIHEQALEIEKLRKELAKK